MHGPIKIDLPLLGDLVPYQGQWIAISRDGKIVAHGTDCDQTLATVSKGTEVALLKVPSVRIELFPSLLDLDDLRVSEIDYSVSESQRAELAAAFPAGSIDR